MELLKLMLVDDEAIILKGLLQTYPWNAMGFVVVGAAGSGEEALIMLEEEDPDVVITDVRMKRISGLELITRSKMAKRKAKFIVLSAYKDFEYAKKACEEGAISYLVKPVDEKELEAVMTKAYRLCLAERRQEQRLRSYQRVLSKDGKSLLHELLERYVKEIISEDEFYILADDFEAEMGIMQFFCSICADIDAAGQVINQNTYKNKRSNFFLQIENRLQNDFKLWNYKGAEGSLIVVVRLKNPTDKISITAKMKQLEKENNEAKRIVISNVYAGLGGIKTSYRQAVKLFELAEQTEEGLLISQRESKLPAAERYFDDMEEQVIHAVRKNSKERLKAIFEQLVYHLPEDDKIAKSYLHRLAVKTEVASEDSYGISDNIRASFANFYQLMHQCSLLRMIDLLYKLLVAMVEERCLSALPMTEENYIDYMELALAYINEHLAEEELSVTTVAEVVYLNPAYFGRLFKNMMGMPFKEYLRKERMNRAKKQILQSSDSIAEIGRRVGIPNPSYFSQLFKQTTGKLPSEFKRN